MPVDYQKGQIYFIRSHQTDKVYVGSTTQGLSLRMAGHRKEFKRYKEGKTNYTSSFDLLELGDAYIEWVEDCCCNSKKELEAREGYWIRKTDCVNKHIMGRTLKEWCDDNKEELQQKARKRYEENKEAILQKCKEYREKHKEELLQKRKEYCEKNKDEFIQYQKEYREKHRDERNQKAKEYYEKNKDTILQKAREKVECECGRVVSRWALSGHKKSKIHKEWEERSEEPEIIFLEE